MLTVALAGRPNVGKSTLFNSLTKTNNAIVYDTPGVTRDKQYGVGEYQGHEFIVIDCGGIGETNSSIGEITEKIALEAASEADCILFIVDAHEGVMGDDFQVLDKLRRLDKPIALVVNKIDGVDYESDSLDFYSLGLDDVFWISAKNKHGTSKLALALVDKYSKPTLDEFEDLFPENAIKVTVVGKPNVGKSTLINRILGESRLMVFDSPGTTIDSIAVPFEYNSQKYILVDTAGVRKKAKISLALEKFSVVKTLESIKQSNVVILVVDSSNNISSQDLKLIDFSINAGKCLVVVVNKWDEIDEDEKKKLKRDIEYKLSFVSFSDVHYISALHGNGINKVWGSINKSYDSAVIDHKSKELTEILEKLVKAHQPPLVKGKRIKLRYAHMGGKNPPVIVIHGNQTKHLEESYKRYLTNGFIKALNIVGTPLQLVFKTSDNPFAHIKNKLTPRQVRKKMRLKKYNKKSKK